MSLRGYSTKVLYVGYLPPRTGGAALSSWLLLEALARLGCDIQAIRVDQGGVSELPAQLGGLTPFPVTPLATPVGDVTPGDDPRLAAREAESRVLRPVVEQAILSRRPDVLFLGMESIVHFLGPLARVHAVPCMARMTGSYANRIITGTLSPELTQDWLCAVRCVDRVVCITSAMREGLAARGVANLSILQNGVDLDQFRPSDPDEGLRRRLGIPADSPVLFHASTLKQVKRPLDLVAAFEILSERMPECRLLIVGDGPRRAEIESMCQRKGLADKLHMAGWTQYHQMPAYYSLADIVVMPSEMEGQSRVYLEAQACGKLLVASDIPAARSVVEHGRSGLLFRKGDPRDLADKLYQALADAPARRRMEAAALKAVRAEHGLAAIARQYYREIRALVGANSTR